MIFSGWLVSDNHHGIVWVQSNDDQDIIFASNGVGSGTLSQVGPGASWAVLVNQQYLIWVQFSNTLSSATGVFIGNGSSDNVLSGVASGALFKGDGSGQAAIFFVVFIGDGISSNTILLIPAAVVARLRSDGNGTGRLAFEVGITSSNSNGLVISTTKRNYVL